jgi:type IV pilus assembly protein PilE
MSALIIKASCDSSPRAKQACAGFTLIETLISLAITAVLSSIAYPSFDGQVQRARRSDALVTVMLVQLAEERWRANRQTYASLTEIGMPGTSPSGHYTLQLASVSEQGYELLATATGPQARDTSCRNLRLSMLGANATYASGPDAGVANSASVNRLCWGQ